MKQLFGFLYSCLVVFAILGGLGCCFYYGAPQFGIALTILGVVLGLGFFKVIELPNKNFMD